MALRWSPAMGAFAMSARQVLFAFLLLAFADGVSAKCCPHRFEDIWQYILTPFITLCIGYGTNTVAVKMLFHPREPKKLCCLTLQGVFPKRQTVLAEKIGETVNNRLLTHADIREYMLKDQFQASLVPVIEKIVDSLLTTGLDEVHPQFGMMLAGAQSLKQKLHKDFVAEMVEGLPEITKKISSNMEKTTKIDQMVEEKIREMSLADMEKMFLDFMEEEFKFIEFLGGFLGFFVGLIQALVFYFT
eukprot:TRINITY_DN8635_c0_g1_i2.p4 TRINITY_DN8635_c0_g1~~TRINITY_DN8635_c0_g1_i2.p4  ORF type:complete len:245 (+),score=119.02 TRINITY_DN8635_c0_g1_i2:66-800(+)